MAGYSGTPLPQKLGIKEGATVGLIGAPEGFEEELQPLPPGVTFRRQARGRLDVAVCFVTRATDLERRFSKLAQVIDQAGGLWVAWPKKASGRATDLHEQAVRDIGLAAGLVDNKVCAIDDTWSGLRFVYRRRDRARLFSAP